MQKYQKINLRLNYRYNQHEIGSILGLLLQSTSFLSFFFFWGQEIWKNSDTIFVVEISDPQWYWNNTGNSTIIVVRILQSKIRRRLPASIASLKMCTKKRSHACDTDMYFPFSSRFPFVFFLFCFGCCSSIFVNFVQIGCISNFEQE